MNTLMKRNNSGSTAAMPFGGMVDKLFGNDLGRLLDDDFWGFNGVNHSTGVPVNVKETNTAYELELVAPGLKKEDLKVSIDGDTLTVAMEHQEQNKEQDKEKGWLRREYRRQAFSRSFKLDDSIDVNKIAASYTDGILHLSLPKKEEAKRISRSIQIS